MHRVSTPLYPTAAAPAHATPIPSSTSAALPFSPPVTRVQPWNKADLIQSVSGLEPISGFLLLLK